jgi:tetratricopeptide (TPR) repeat protein
MAASADLRSCVGRIGREEQRLDGCEDHASPHSDNSNAMRLCLLLVWMRSVSRAEDALPRAERLIAAGRFQEAIEALNESSARTARWHLAASRAYDGVNNPKRAVAEVEAALAAEPRNEAAHLQLGQIFLSRNTPAAAYEVFNDAQQMFPESFLIRLGKGLALKELQRYDEAAAELRVCLSRQPESGVTFDALATVYLHASRFDALMKLAQDHIRLNPRDYRGYYYVAAGREGLNLPQAQTLELLEQSQQLNPDFAAGLGLQGKLLLRENRTAEALKALERAVELRPDHVPSHMALASAYRKTGRESDAAREFETIRRLLKEQREQPVLRYHRGDR